MGIWGKYNDDAFKLHIQGVHKNFGSIEYDGVERSVYRKKFHRNSTVVILNLNYRVSLVAILYVVFFVENPNRPVKEHSLYALLSSEASVF